MISSAANSKFRTWLSLLEPKGIKKHGRFLLFGEKVVQETLNCRTDLIEAVLLSEKQPENSIGENSAKVSREILANDLFRQLDVFGTRAPMAVCRCPEIPAWNPQAETGGLTLLCPLGDPANLGALIRTASAFDVQAMVLLQEAATPFHPKAVRAASGSLFSLPLFQGPSIRALAPLSLPSLIALDARGSAMRAFQWPDNPLLLVGEEGPGIPQDLQCEKLSIPLKNNVESLNATVAAAIALSHFALSHSR